MEIKRVKDSYFNFVDEVQGAEGVKILHAILELRENQKPPFSRDITKVLFTLAMLYTVLGNFIKVPFNAVYKLKFV